MCKKIVLESLKEKKKRLEGWIRTVSGDDFDSKSLIDNLTSKIDEVKKAIKWAKNDFKNKDDKKVKKSQENDFPHIRDAFRDNPAAYLNGLIKILKENGVGGNVVGMKDCMIWSYTCSGNLGEPTGAVYDKFLKALKGKRLFKLSSKHLSQNFALIEIRVIDLAAADNFPEGKRFEVDKNLRYDPVINSMLVDSDSSIGGIERMINSQPQLKTLIRKGHLRAHPFFGMDKDTEDLIILRIDFI
jgi:hypothetical protein